MNPELSPDRIDHFMREDLQAYAKQGMPLCDFLIAIVSNDFVRALERADDKNIAAIAAFGNYLYNHMPQQCWGSLAVYNAWVNYHEAKRTGADPAAMAKLVEAVEDAKIKAQSRRP